ncbi:hypothetical protein [Ensifer soli]|uniref:hypothetical protein n=1 Tax=Ciceribacter sp. sgz301302 TaxID=3342379 RepID=UPI0035B77D22
MTRVTTYGEFSFSADFRSPAPRGARYFNFFRGGSGVLLRNLVKGQPAAQLAGTPTFGAGFASLKSQTTYLDTVAAETASMTFYCVARGVGSSTGTTRPIFLGNYAASALGSAGVSLYPNNATTIGGSAGTNNSGALSFVTATANTSPNNWSFYSVVVDDAADLVTVRDWTAGTVGTMAMPYARDLTNTRTIRIGSGYASTFAGNCDINCAGIHTVALNDNELTQVYARAQAVAALDGITI